VLLTDEAFKYFVRALVFNVDYANGMIAQLGVSQKKIVKFLRLLIIANY